MSRRSPQVAAECARFISDLLISDAWNARLSRRVDAQRGILYDSHRRLEVRTAAFLLHTENEAKVHKTGLGYGCLRRGLDCDRENVLGESTRSATDCVELGSAPYAALADRHKLRHLSLAWAADLHDSQFEKFIRKNPDLETLNLISCRPLPENGIREIYSLKKLRDLGITLCLRIHEASPFGLGAPNPRNISCLEYLRSLYLNDDITDEVLHVICESPRKLEVLKLGHCVKLADAGCMNLRRLENLRSLSLIGAFGLTDLALKRELGSSAMESLEIDGPGLTDSGLITLV